MDHVLQFFQQLDNLVWGAPLLVLLVGTGIYLTLRLGLLQIRYLPKAFRLIFTEDEGHGDISSFGALATALAATVGTGNIVGVATAIQTGGPGALFWMWMAAFFGMATKYAEGLLAIRYRTKDDNGHISGGPMYYILHGMGEKWRPLAIFFAVAGVLVALFGIGTMTQVNSITGSLQASFGTAPEVASVVIALVVSTIIFGGIHWISKVSEKVVRRIMKQEKLIIRRKRRQKYNSYKGEITPAVENVIDRDFHATKPNQKWLTDITEFSIKAGKIYLSPIIDCLDGMPVSWTIGTFPNAELANTMLRNAIATLKPNEKPIVHSDRGCHYCWPEWIQIMEEANLTRSMSKKGCSPDNSACEGFFGHLKTEMFYGHDWDEYSIEEFIQEINGYMGWYCKDRIKSTLGGLSPLDYRRSIGIAV